MTRKQLEEEYKTLDYWLDGAYNALHRSKLLHEKMQGRGDAPVSESVRSKSISAVYNTRVELRNTFAPEIGRLMCKELER